MSKTIEKIKSNTYNQDYNRLIRGERLNVVNRPYTTEYIKDLIFYFEELEEYEKCSALIKVIKKIENHNFNYKK
jgi:hypothetical protein